MSNTDFTDIQVSNYRKVIALNPNETPFTRAAVNVFSKMQKPFYMMVAKEEDLDNGFEDDDFQYIESGYPSVDIDSNGEYGLIVKSDQEQTLSYKVEFFNDPPPLKQIAKHQPIKQVTQPAKQPVLQQKQQPIPHHIQPNHQPIPHHIQPNHQPIPHHIQPNHQPMIQQPTHQPMIQQPTHQPMIQQHKRLAIESPPLKQPLDQKPNHQPSIIKPPTELQSTKVTLPTSKQEVEEQKTNFNTVIIVVVVVIVLMLISFMIFKFTKPTKSSLQIPATTSRTSSFKPSGFSKQKNAWSKSPTLVKLENLQI
jgi:hypothetical protein